MVIIPEIDELIPQKPPFVMIDRLVSAGDNTASGELTVRNDNVLYNEGFLREPGIMEFMAQTAAAYTGFRKIINREKMVLRISKMQDYFAHYGGKTIFFGRFIPFGARNAIFMTCGLIRMRLIKFMSIDLLALICTSTFLFTLGYTFGNNYEKIFPYLDRYKLVIFGFFIVLIVVLIVRKKLAGGARRVINKGN